MTRNLTLLADFYELTMASAYLENDHSQTIGYFDMFFRKVPDNGGYAIFAGLEQFVERIQGLNFSDDDIEYLRSKNMFSEAFLGYLKNFRFECDIWAVEEGTPIFPGEPIVVVRGPMIQAQFIETILLLTINHQSLIATKASRICNAADGRDVIEFGARRAQGYDAALYGARASYIGGCSSTSCTLAEKMFGIPSSGTMAHSWVQMFDSEYEAFEKYARTYPENTVLLVDTYNVLNSGVPNAIRVFDEVLKPMGFKPKAIRLDSGDIAYLSIKAREMLDAAGYQSVKIMASNSLDEFLIRDLIVQGAKIDMFGVGEGLITSRSEPVFGGVYKLCAKSISGGEIVPRIKISENVFKITTPNFKKLYRLYSRETGKAIADVITLFDEHIDDSEDYTIFHPIHTWKKLKVKNFIAKPLLIQIFDSGRLVYNLPKVNDIRQNTINGIQSLWGEVTRLENPHIYKVDLSKKLWDIKNDLLEKNSF